MGTENNNLGIYQAKERVAMLTTGNVYFVDSGASLAVDSPEYGASPDRPFATLDFAVGRCTANNGDLIYVMPGHSETLIADSGVDVDVAGVKIVGMGSGADRPTFDFTTTTAADFKLAAANVSIENLLFTSGIDDQAMMIETSGDDVEIGFCEFRNNSSTQALILVNIGVASNDSDRFYMHDCRLISDTASATGGISITALQAGIRLEDNYVRGDYSTAAITSAVIHTDCVVKGNYIQNDNNTAYAIKFTTTSTGMVQDNILVTDAIATALDLGNCFASGNMYQDDGDQDVTATPIPSAATTGGTTMASLHAVPGQDATTDVNMRDVIGKKDDTASTSVVTTDSIMSYLKGLIGFHTVPTADATTDAQMRDVIGRKTDTSSNVVVATDSLMSYLKGLVADTGVQTLTKVSATGSISATPDPLFTITGGPIHVVSLVGNVTVDIQDQSCTLQVRAAVTTPAATPAMSTAVQIQDDDNGTTYTFVGGAGVLTPTSAGAVIIDMASATLRETEWVVPIGGIEMVGSATNSGEITWVMTYYANDLATVVVAA